MAREAGLEISGAKTILMQRYRAERGLLGEIEANFVPGSGRHRRRSENARPQWRSRVAEFCSVKQPRPARESGAGELLEILVYQQAARVDVLKAWSAKYKDAGPVVIGGHAPEFGFEKDVPNVRNAVSELHFGYPIPIGSDHAIREAFCNEYWPADYIVDTKGRICYRHFGEADCEKSERTIQALLKENGVAGLDDSTVRITANGAEASPSADVRSPETYAG